MGLIVLTFAAGIIYFWASGSWGTPTAPDEIQFGDLADLEQVQADGAATASTNLSVLSIPPGATVLLDFDSIGVTPLQQYPIAEGAYIMSLRQPNGAELDTVIFVEGSTSTFRFDLNRRPLVNRASVQAAGLSTSAPEQPAVRLPAAAAVPAGAPEETRSRRAASPNAAGMLVVLSEPAGGTVYVDQVALGVTPLIQQDVGLGPHTVTIRRDGYAPYIAEVNVVEGEALKVVGQLKALTGTLLVLVQPWGSIYIDGKLHRQDTDVQYRTELPVGRHHVRVVHPQLGTWERTVEVEGGATQQLAVHFQEGQEAAASATEPAPAEAEPVNERLDAASLLDENGVYVMAEEAPQFRGSMEELYRMARYPNAAYEAGIQGKVFLRFIVNEEGNVENAYVTRGIGGGCDEEALRLIQLARFSPGKIHGVPVRVWHSMYINFQIRK